MCSFLRTTFYIAGIAFLMTACGGGGGGGSDGVQEIPNPKAVIGDNNAAKLATTANEGVVQSFDGFVIASKTVQAMLDTLTCSSGTVDNNYNATAGSGNITFKQCDASGFVLDGTVTISATRSGDIFTSSYVVNNFTFNSSSKEQSFVCETIISTDSTSCNFSSTNIGSDGRTYVVSDATVSKSGISYTISAKILDPEYGSISITTVSPVIPICTGFKPGSGEIQFTDGDGKVVSVIYDSCTSYTVSYSGVSNTYDW